MEFRHDTSVFVFNVTTDPYSLLLADAGTGCFHSVAAAPSVSQSEAEQRLLWERKIKREVKPKTSRKLLMDGKHKVSNPQWFTRDVCKAKASNWELLADCYNAANVSTRATNPGMLDWYFGTSIRTGCSLKDNNLTLLVYCCESSFRIVYVLEEKRWNLNLQINKSFSFTFL